MKASNTLFIIFFTGYFFSQNHSISYRQLEIINYSVQITYVNNSYSPTITYQGTLRTLQERYDYYYSMINNAWGKVRYCELINVHNNLKMREHDKEVGIYLQNFSRVDWAANGNLAIQIRDWIISIFNNKHIKAELNVLQAINREYYRLKRKYPEDFYKRGRYLELGKVLKLIEQCEPSKVAEIGMEYGLF